MSMTFAEWTKQKKEKEEASKSNSSNTTSNSNVQSFEEWSKKKKVEMVDQDYINAFVTDANAFFNSANENSKNLGYDNASSLYDTVSSTRIDLKNRAKNISSWLELNKDRIDEKTYTSLSDTLSGFENDSLSVAVNFRKAKEYYSQWETEEDYNNAVASAEEYERLKNLDIEAEESAIKMLEAGGRTGAMLDKKKTDLAKAKRIQKEIELSSVIDPNSSNYDKEYEIYSGKGKEEGLKIAEEHWIGYDDYEDALIMWRENPEEGLKRSNVVNGYTYESDDAWAAQLMTDDEYKIYTYYYGKYGRDKAREYLDSIQETLTSRKASQLYDNVKESTFATALFAFAAGTEQFVTGLENLFSEEDYYAPTAGQLASGMLREDLEDNFWGQLGYDVLNTTGNMLPSILVGTATGGIGGTLAMGASAVGNAKAEMINLGYSKAQANAYGALVGASEAGLQYLLGGITSLGGKVSGGITGAILSKVDNAFARTAIKLGGSMLSEGFEEGLQTILEPWFKSVVTDLDFEAPDIDEVLYSSLLGALSAGMLEGTGTVAGEVGTYKQGATIKASGTEGIDRLTSLGKTFSADTVAYKLAGKVNENTGAYTIGRLLNEVGASLSQQNLADIEAALVSRNMKSKDAKTISKWLNKAVDGSNFSKRQIKALENNEIVSQVFKEVIIDQNSTVNQRILGYNEYLNSLNKKKASPTETVKETTQPFSDEEMIRRIAEATGQDASVIAQQHAQQGKALESNKNAPVEQSAENKAENVSDSGKTINKSTGEEVNIQKVTETKGGLKVELDNGMVVSASDLSYSTNAEAMMFEMFSRMEASPEATNAMMNAFKPSSLQEASLYHVGVPLAYQYGKIGYEAGLKSIKLPQKDKQFAYNRGREDAQAKAEAKSKATAKASGKETATKKGKVILDKSVPSEADFTDVQKASMEGIKFIAEVSSLEIHVYASFVENGKTMAYINGRKRKAPNGYYMEGTNKIYIDLNAGNNREGTMLFTSSHEVAHYIAEWNYKGFKELGDFLIKNFGDINAPVHELIEKQIAKKKRSYELDNIPVPSESQLYDEAYEELVADAMSKMFADKQAYVKLADLKKQNKTLWQKLGEAISKLLDKIKSVIGIYSEQSPGAKEAKWVEKFNSEVYGKLQDLYLKAFVEADANYQASSAEETAGVGKRKESGRDDFDWNSEEGQLIATAMDMETCKQMIERTYRIVNPNQYEDTPIYRNGDHWLETVGAEEVALYVDNEYTIQEKYLNNIPALYEGEISVEEIIEAYQAGVLKGTNNKKEAVRLDVTKGSDYSDTRFYAPKKIEGAKALYELANQKITNANRQEVTNARAKILLFAHNRGAVEELGITQSELNKKLRTWSNYSAKARDISQRINNGVAFSNKWTGIENSTYLNNATVSEEDFASLVGDISGHSSEYERRFIASTMLALDTHIDYTGIKFIFGEKNFDKGSVLGIYSDDTRTIKIRQGSNLNTVAHEIGHAIDHQWTRDVWNWSGREAKGYQNCLSDGIRVELVTDPEVAQWVKNYLVFVDNISDSGAIYNEYAQSKSEVFARFVAKFVEWTMQVATGRNQSFGYSNYSGDKFTGAQFIEFVKILQEKAKLDSKYQSAIKDTVKFSERDSEEDLTKLREEYSKAYKLQMEAKKDLDSIGEYPRFAELTDVITDQNSSKETIDEILADYSKWKAESGYDEAYEKHQSLDRKVRELRSEADRMEERLSKALREKKYSEEEVKAIVQKAVRKFHTTPYLSRASYLLTTGSMLDFSEGQGYRGKDHREISEILNLPEYAQYSDGMIVFMNMGNIRLQTYGIDISVMPNDKQISSLRSIISSVMREYDEFTVDFSKPNGNSDGSVTYPKGVASSKIISDIKNYFETGNVPEYEDSLSQFRYSERDSLGNELSAEQQEFFKDSKIRDSKGNLKVVYHGTKAQFNTFAKGDIGFHFGTKGAARGRVGTGKNVTIKEVYLNITNPIYINKDLGSWNADTLAVELFNMKLLTKAEAESVLFTDDKLYRRSTDSANKKLREMLLQKGYDGIEYRNTFESKKDSTSYIAFESSQIKEVTNQSPTPNANIKYDERDGENDMLTEHAVQTALYDSLDHADKGDDNLIRISNMPKYIVDLLGIDGDFYIYRNHAYENMVSEEQAKNDGRFDRKANYHNLGIETMTDAIMSMENPIMTIATKSKDGNPTVIMLLPVFGKNNTPLYSVLSFYSDKPINGELTKKPHIVLSIHERNYFEDGGRAGLADIVKSAIDDGRVLDFDKKRREDLSVIAKSAGLGNITETSLNKSLAQFKKFVNSFRIENKIDYSERDDLNEIKSNLKKYNIDPRRVTALADSYLENYGGVLNKTQFRLQFYTITEAVAEASTTGNVEALERADRETKDLADEIVNSPKATGAMASDINAIKKHLKGIRIKIPKYNKGDFDAIGGFENFRKKHMGKLLLANNGLDIDTLYPELQELFGTGYFPDNITHVADQLMKIAEVIDTPIKPEINYDVDEAREYLVSELSEKIVNIIYNQVDSRYINDRVLNGDESNRTLLVNALEGAVVNDIEMNNLKKYKEKIKLIDAEQAKLSELRAEANELRFKKGRTEAETKRMRELDAEATQTANRINTYDKQLLNLESTTALKNVLQREKEMARKRERQKGYEALKAYKEKALATQREIITRNQESRKKAVENRHKTEMRHKIKSVVSDLNKLLLHGTKERNIKPGLQQAVAMALEAINMDTVSADARIAKLEEDLLKAKTPEKIEEIQHKIDYIKNMGDWMSDKLEALGRAYREIKNSTGNEYSSQFKEEASLIENKIESVISKVGKTPLRDMSLSQLEAVYELYTMVLTTIRNANSVWRQGKLEDLQQNASAVMEEIDKHPKMKSEGSKLRQIIRQFKWNEMTPYYAFDNIGSPTLKKLFYDFVEAQNVYGRDVAEVKEFANSTRKKYGYSKWDLDKMYEFQLRDGRVFNTTLKHLMSIYAYSKRDQALDHMSKGGFFHNDKQTFRKKGGILEMVRTDDVGYKVDSLVLVEIKNALTKEQIAYVDEMQEYLTKMGEKGNEVTRVMWGIDIFKEKVYFPLKSKNDFIKSSTETAQAVSLKNDGMTKETVPGASNPIVLEAFDDVWARHTERMSQYHAFVIPIDNMNKVHQYGTWAGTESTSVSTMLAGRFGNAVNEYITQFIKDMNGSVVTQGVTNPFMSFFSKFKKTAVGMSLSTVVQQPTAIVRAMSLVDGKYFVGKPNLSRLSTKWEELKTYAPIAIIKEIGGFDAGSGTQVTHWINSDTARGIDKVMNVIDDISMKGAELADVLGWTTIWEAVKRETKATTNLAVGSQAFLEKAGERFTEVIVQTQVYDSTLSRSAFMRSKNDGVKMLTSFMGEPTLAINMMYNAVVNAIRGGKGAKMQAAKTIGLVYASTILASAFASAIYALNDDDEDESYLEKYMQSIGGEFISDIVLLPVSSLPVLRDIVSIFQGWDVERADMSIIKDIYDSFTSLDSENKSTYRKIEDFAGAIGSIFGLSVKNLLRTGRQLFNIGENIFDGIEGGDLGNAFIEGVTGEEKVKSQKLYEAIVNGDSARLEVLKKGYKDEEAYEQAVRKALKEFDPRIQEAAQARYDGDISEYTRIAKEIIAEGNFVQDTVVSAINSAIADIKNAQPSNVTEENEDKDEVTSIYSTSDINSAFENGDNAMALEIIQDLIDTKVANGKEEKEAKSSLRSSMTSYWKPLYIKAYRNGDTTEMYRIRKILLASGLYGSNGDDVVNTVKNWLK